MKQINKNSFWYSWPAIIIAFWLFWPVGLFLLFKKFSVDKKAAMKAGGASLKIIGIVLIVIISDCEIIDRVIRRGADLGSSGI